jgi:hypothetical protein
MHAGCPSCASAHAALCVTLAGRGASRGMPAAAPMPRVGVIGSTITPLLLRWRGASLRATEEQRDGGDVEWLVRHACCGSEATMGRCGGIAGNGSKPGWTSNEIQIEIRDRDDTL